MGRINLFLLLTLLILGCGSKKIEATKPSVVTDTLMVYYFGNINDCLLPNGKNTLAKISNLPRSNSIIIAYFHPFKCFSQNLYNRLDLSNLLKKHYNGILIASPDFSRSTSSTPEIFPIAEPNGYLVKNFKFSRVGIIIAPEAEPSESLYFYYRKNLSILKARSDIIITISVQPDSLYENFLNINRISGPKAIGIEFTDHIPTSYFIKEFDALNIPEDSAFLQGLIALRQNLIELRSEPLIDFSKLKIQTPEQFEHYLARRLIQFFSGDFLILPRTAFRLPPDLKNSIWTIDSLIEHIDCNLTIGLEKMKSAEIKKILKNCDCFASGKIKKETLVVTVKESGENLVDIIYQMTGLR